jgi:ribosomal protein RSM22 (predicted rRNA methylase)
MAGDTWCHFVQRVQRPKAQMDAKNASVNFEDEKFSYLVIRRGKKPVKPTATLEQLSEDEIVPASYYWPRILRRPIKNNKHILMDLCTPAGKLERRIVGKSQKQAYVDAKDAFWGDIWPHKEK